MNAIDLDEYMNIVFEPSVKSLPAILQSDRFDGKQEDTELGCLMQDFHCKFAGDIHSGVLAKRVYELKETQEGVDSMCREMDQIYSEGEKNGEERGRIQGIAEGLAAGEMKKAKETALSLAERGMSIADIAEIVKVSVKLVQEWLSGSVNLVK